jgi:hypothetical protein
MAITYNFFATAEDIQKVLMAVEASHKLQYILCGMFDSPDQPIFYRFSSLPGLGVALTGQSQLEPTFLAMPARTHTGYLKLTQAFPHLIVKCMPVNPTFV